MENFTASTSAHRTSSIVRELHTFVRALHHGKVIDFVVMANYTLYISIYSVAAANVHYVTNTQHHNTHTHTIAEYFLKS